MAALTQNYDEKAKLDDLVAYKMAANVTIYKGALVFVRVADGYAYPARSGTATDIFVGIAEHAKTSGSVAGVDEVQVRKIKTAVYNASGLVQTDVGATVYAADDNTITKTATNNVSVGVLVGVAADGNSGRIRINSAVK